ncbi:MerR family transcriptional regulator [uncultured Phascolarctobacterium sp.]|uniref:MerR family transcriptional regulator n=1 Tax=uncultured Phascolarctobacterium sp. TaxID=512296 RepID=UPI0025D5F0D6|nr:MerR family transcriptional regulator [uncultured Phascolarctobacterium sp.]
MKKPIDNYFTTGELASLCKIPRKTLLYYDSLGLITPEVVEENGYRYYKRTQLFALELILTMRKLDIPLAEIKSYLANKSYSNYQQLLADRETLLEHMIEKMISLKNELHHSIINLQQLENIKFNKILTVQTGDEFLCLSQTVAPKMNFKDRTKISASLFIDLAEHIPLNNHTFGYIVDKDTLRDLKAPRHIKYYFYPVFTETAYPQCMIKPGGTYLTLYFQGIYMDNYDKYINALSEYCSDNKLLPVSDIYITSVKNFWLTDAINEYIYKIEIQIK